jgi:hypothetical protein
MGDNSNWRVDLDAGLAYGPDRLLVVFSRRPGDPDFMIRVEPRNGHAVSIENLAEIAEAVSEAIRVAVANRQVH